jgi:hypothetical protein
MDNGRVIQYSPGKIDLESCMLVNRKKEYIELREIMLEINLFYDIYANGLHASIVIYDTNGIIENFPVVGDEYLILSFGTPGEDDYKRNVFFVSSIKNRSKEYLEPESFVIEAYSLEFLNNSRKSVDNSYNNMTISGMVRSIFNDYVKPGDTEFEILDRTKTLNIQETNYYHSYVFTGRKPLDIIRFLGEEAITLSSGKMWRYDMDNEIINEENFTDTSLGSNYMFFMRSDGWYFQTTDYLMRQDPVDRFYLIDAKTPRRKGDENEILPHQRISSINIMNQLDVLSNINRGMYSFTVETLDPLLKRYTSEKLSYDANSDEVAHLDDDHSLHQEKSFYFEEFDNAYNILMISNIGDYDDAFLQPAKPKDDQIRNPRKIHEILKYKHLVKTQLENIKLEVIIPGNSTIEVGDVVELFIPQSNAIDEEKFKENKLYGGKFFLTAVRHTYNKENNNYFTVMECVKTSYARKLTDE